MIVAITGTSRGVGRHLAEHFLSRGDVVAGCSRGEVLASHANYHHTILDISDEEGVSRWVKSIRNEFSGIDVMICNAALAPANLLALSTSGKVLEDLLKVNIAGSFYVCRETTKIMLPRRSGRIITVSSMAVGLHEEGTSAYSASKSAVVEMTKILAKEVASFGITCNVIAPSMIETDATDALGEKVRERALSKLTIKRTVTSEEICNVVDFFVAPESRCITGQVIHMGLVV